MKKALVITVLLLTFSSQARALGVQFWFLQKAPCVDAWLTKALTGKAPTLPRGCDWVNASGPTIMPPLKPSMIQAVGWKHDTSVPNPCGPAFGGDDPVQFEVTQDDAKLINRLHGLGIKVAGSMSGDLGALGSNSGPQVGGNMAGRTVVEHYLEQLARAGSEVDASGKPTGACPKEGGGVGIDYLWVNEPRLNGTNVLGLSCEGSDYLPKVANNKYCVSCDGYSCCQANTSTSSPSAFFDCTEDLFANVPNTETPAGCVSGVSELQANSVALDCEVAMFNPLFAYYKAHRKNVNTKVGFTINQPKGLAYFLTTQHVPKLAVDFWVLENFGFSHPNEVLVHTPGTPDYKNFRPVSSIPVWVLYYGRGAACQDWNTFADSSIQSIAFWTPESDYCYISWPSHVSYPLPNIADCGPPDLLTWATMFAGATSPGRSALCSGANGTVNTALKQYNQRVCQCPPNNFTVNPAPKTGTCFKTPGGNIGN